MSIISTKPRSLYLFYHEDGLSVTYKGNGLHTLDYGTARMDDNIGKHFEIVVHPNPNQKTKIKKNHNDNVPVVSTPNDNSTASPCPYLRYFECKILRKEADTEYVPLFFEYCTYVEGKEKNKFSRRKYKYMYPRRLSLA